jgi:hypothetical protein
LASPRCWAWLRRPPSSCSRRRRRRRLRATDQDQDAPKTDDKALPKGYRVEGADGKYYDREGVEVRECPECGHNQYQQGRTWTCENCGYSYVE